MKREIKFRAWDGESVRRVKSIWGLDEIDHVVVEDVINESVQTIFPKDTTCILMQYTGLKDKSGKEIWEGDILKRVVDKYIGTNLDTATNHMTKKPEISVVEYKGSCFSAFNNILHRVGKCEVIGNLYENPSLIDKSTINK